MLIEISYGEGLDRLSILEIKVSEIKDKEKLFNINKEIETLNDLIVMKQKYNYYYELLFDVNKQIWDLTNKIKELSYNNSEFSQIAHKIFELNQSRFRIKNVINKLSESNIKEQKSYSNSIIKVQIEKHNLAEISTTLSYLSLNYDIVYIYTNEIMKKVIQNEIPTFNYEFILDNENCIMITDIKTD